MSKKEWRLNDDSMGGVMVRLCERPIVQVGEGAGLVRRCEDCFGPENTCKQVKYFTGKTAREQAEDFLCSMNPNGPMALKRSGQELGK